VSASVIEPALAELADWNVMDVNVRIGPSGIHGHLALDKNDLLREMDRFGINTAVVSHFTAEEYDAVEGNSGLECEVDPRFVPAWAALPDAFSIQSVSARKPLVARIYCGPSRHNFSTARWCSGPLFEYLQQYSILTLISLEEFHSTSAFLGWEVLKTLLSNFPHLPVALLDLGYRSDRYLFPLLERFPTLHFDCSTYSAAHRQLEATVEGFGAERILFGSRLPLYTPGAPLAVLLTARIPDSARRAIAGGNLRRLLHRGEA